MIITIDSNTKKVISNEMNGVTCLLYPDGNIPNLPVLPEGQEYIRLHDEVELVQKISLAYSCELVFDDNCNVIDVNVTKTLEQYWQENPPTLPEPTPEEKIAQLEQQLADTNAMLLEFMEISLGGM